MYEIKLDSLENAMKIKHLEVSKTIQNLTYQTGGEEREENIRYIQGRIDEAVKWLRWLEECMEFTNQKWRQQDSNLRPFTRQANALPAELCLHESILT